MDPHRGVRSVRLNVPSDPKILPPRIIVRHDCKPSLTIIRTGTKKILLLVTYVVSTLTLIWSSVLYSVLSNPYTRLGTHWLLYVVDSRSPVETRTTISTSPTIVSSSPGGVEPYHRVTWTLHSTTTSCTRVRGLRDPNLEPKSQLFNILRSVEGIEATRSQKSWHVTPIISLYGGSIQHSQLFYYLVMDRITFVDNNKSIDNDLSLLT